MNRNLCLMAVYFCLALSPVATALTSTVLAGFPTPAPGAYGVTAAALPDGRFLLWNGETLYFQSEPGSTVYEPVATGYAGDPGFAAVSPDGYSVVLGAGYSGDVYRFDAAVPINFSPDAVIANQAHFAGTFLTATLVLLDAGKPDFSGSELAVLDISGSKSAPLTVVRKSTKYALPKQAVVDKPPFSYSSSMAVDTEAGVVYAMDGNTRELRQFSVSALLQAFQSLNPLDWETDGVLVGQPGVYYSGGAAGITADGRLVIGGSEGYLLPGGIQLVSPASGVVTATLDPSGNRSFYTVAFSPATQTVLAMVEGAYLGEAYAVDLDASAAGETGYSRGGLFEVGDTACFQIPADEVFDVQWYHDGAPIPNATFRELCLFNLQLSDSGQYRAVYDDGSKAPAQYVVTITVGEDVPVSGVLSLIALLAGIALLGGRRIACRVSRG